MFRSKLFPLLASAALAPLAGTAHAQQMSSLESAKPRTEVNLRVQLVISRFEGEKKVSSLPYTFLVSTGSINGTRLRMGVDTPIPIKSTQGDGKPITTINYQTIGTSLDCRATVLPDERYRLSLSVENSAVPANTGGNTELGPLVRKVSAVLEPVLRDGQTLQTTVSTDPVSGDSVRIDVTLNVLPANGK